MTFERAEEYAKWCAEDKSGKVPHYVKLQAADWLNIAEGKFDGVFVCRKTYAKISKVLKLIVHPDLGLPMLDTIEDYALFLIVAVFCTKQDDGTRFYQTVVLEIARKNFKTFTSAVIFILLMLTEPRFSRFFSVAPDLKLSSELKVAIRKIIKSSPALDEVAFKTLRSEVRCLLTDSDYIPLAYSQDKMDGKTANAFLADEAGAMDSYPIEAMRSSQITLRNKLGVIISTQYPNDNNALIDEIDKSKKTLDGLRANKRRFSLLYEPDGELQMGDRWMDDDNVLYQSNPVAVKNEAIREEIKNLREDAVLYENSRENYLCKHNNIRYKSLGTEGYVDIVKVREGRRKEDLDFWRGRSVYIGLDLSMTDDNTSVAMVTPDGDGLRAKVWGFVPADRIDVKTKKEDVDYRKLIREKCCFACGSEVINYGDVEKFILSLSETYGVRILQVGYDRYNAISTVQKLEAGGLECVEIKQHSSVLHSPTKLLREKILSGQFFYDENLMLEINFQNARCTEDTNKNKYVNKKRSAGKVDMVVALINATYLAEQALLYGDGGFFVQM